MAAALASCLYGIKKGLKLETPATKGNGYEDYSNGALPKNLWESSQKMKQSKIAKELFGDDFVDHFTKTREWEWREFSKEVTDWETKRYFEIFNNLIISDYILSKSLNFKSKYKFIWEKKLNF